MPPAPRSPFATACSMRSAARRATLVRALPAGLTSASAVTALKGLIIAGACLPNGEGWLRRGLQLLCQELPRQLLADGGHIERSPRRMIELLRDLIDIRAAVNGAGRDLPRPDSGGDRGPGAHGPPASARRRWAGLVQRFERGRRLASRHGPPARRRPQPALDERARQRLPAAPCRAHGGAGRCRHAAAARR